MHILAVAASNAIKYPAIRLQTLTSRTCIVSRSSLLPVGLLLGPFALLVNPVHWAMLIAATIAAAVLQPAALPVQGLHVLSLPKANVDEFVRFVETDLKREGVNLIVLEVDYNFDFKSRPEMAEPGGLNHEDARKIAEACKRAGIRLIPQMGMLGHQSWAKDTGKLLTVYPHFDETPGKYPNNEGIYCRSYCPRHPEVHKVLFPLIDEMCDAFQADAFHAGMDEAFILGDADCARCKDAPKATLFAEEVTRIQEHLKSKKREMWMWGDRFLDAKITGLGEWEASTNETAPSLRMISKDVVICDWHYENAPPTAAWFAGEGFRVVSSPWRKPHVALSQLEQILAARKGGAKTIADRLLGTLHTTWVDGATFMKAYRGEETNDAAKETVATFKALMKAIRGEK